MLGRLTLGGLVAGALLFAAYGVTAGTASAQYPEPSGACEAVTSVTVTAPGGSVDIVVTVRDAQGNVLPGGAVDARIVSQPGTGATLSPASGVADANGQFRTTLTMGTGTGTAQIEVDCGDVQTGVAVVAEVAGETLAPPQTGFGFEEGDRRALVQWGITLVSAAIALFALAGLRMARRERSR